MSVNSPPIYTIDLSLPPRSRYKAVAREYAPTLHQLTSLYTEVVAHLKLPPCFFHYLGRLLLRRLASNEQTEELRGISEECGVPMYLLVAYNVFLDLLLGCTSGGVLTKKPEQEGEGKGGEGDEEVTMMHFRTLDWSMPVLRDVIVQFDYINSPQGEVIARIVGYVGFVGILTGVRKGLSVSLNFRPYHNASGLSLENARYYWNTLLILLGRRPSITTVIRDFLLPRPKETPRVRRKLSKKRGRNGRKQQDLEEEKEELVPTYHPPHPPDAVTSLLPTLRTPVAYLIFCTPDETLILEKDFRTANILRSPTFLATTNHDIALEPHSPSQQPTTTSPVQPHIHAFLQSSIFQQASVQDILDDSIYRKECLTLAWRAWRRRRRQQEQQQERQQEAGREEEQSEMGVPLSTLERWVERWPVSNATTHFACIMDPGTGVFRWVRKFEAGEIVEPGVVGEGESVSGDM
ncbi:hypothetical protein COCMIDRAFT_107206 [Bipolaris oryzae ATCC 44560]|uniref:ceramidase n=1 Tax=Bipolaris oryzae ATCC 44560 TaxID=930090 RepID=W6YZS2_COCMI|nr:uncharacterized protein COCMIDRAFT_107206 [Bipolaris oryzae ATCC 44560]EUC41044.1 hypothetical protein COCMIDRAFT_107206 [Bipolaris oryzae ATCC 44560]